MKGFAAVCAVALALTARAAFAENDAASAPPPPPRPPWTGYYGGLDVGYAWDPNVYTSAFPVQTRLDGVVGKKLPLHYTGLTYSGASALSVTGISDPNVSGFIGGGQVGYNYQFGNSFVAGIEADIQGAGVRGRGGFVGVGSVTVYPPSACLPGGPPIQ